MLLPGPEATQLATYLGWLSAEPMVDGLALGETTPGPLIMLVVFMGGWSSALFGGPGSWLAAVAASLTTAWFSFLPSFGFILAGAPLVEASRDDLRLGAPLTAITAAVVGVIVSLALLLQLRFGWSVLQLIGAAAPAGLLQALLTPWLA